MLASSPLQSGFLVGTGVITNVSLGFVPDRLELLDLTAGTTVYEAYPSSLSWAFTLGGAGTIPGLIIQPGTVIVGATSGASATVKFVGLTSGNFGAQPSLSQPAGAAGNAAGILILDATTVLGTFSTGEKVYIKGGLNAGAGSQNDAQMTTLPVVLGVKQVAAAGDVGDLTVTAYLGSVSAQPGFSITAADDISGHLFAWTATRS
jgi:hypothetical protein